MIVTCVVCGRTFKSRASNAKYCSEDCRRKTRNLKSQAQRKERTLFVKTCLICGRSFETFTSNKLYCSKECKKTAERRRKKTRPVRMTVEKAEVFDLCSICGTENVQVGECPVCGFLVCSDCRDSSGTCKICAARAADS